MGRIWTCDEDYNGNAFSYFICSDSNCTTLVDRTDYVTGDDDTQPRLEQISTSLYLETNGTWTCRRFVECSDTSISAPSLSPTIAPSLSPTIAPSVSPTQLTLQSVTNDDEHDDEDHNDTGNNAKMYRSIRIIILLVAFGMAVV